MHDVAIGGMHVVLGIDRAGVVGEERCDVVERSRVDFRMASIDAHGHLFHKTFTKSETLAAGRGNRP